MGQKVNPVGFRLGVNKGWNTLMYVSKNIYSKVLLQDLKIRQHINESLKTAGVVDIVIKRSMSRILVEISVSRPGVVIGKGGAGIDKLKKEISRLIQSKHIEIKLYEVKNPETSAKLIAEAVAAQVERRIVPKFAAQRELENAKNTGKVKGVRVWVSGRIKGAEIARTEKFQWGSIPLQTLRADIDYAYHKCSVPNAGLHGIKVWVYKGEK